MNQSDICFREPIPEIFTAANMLRQAVSAYHGGNHNEAAVLIKEANMQSIRDWTESLWGKASPHVIIRVIEGAPAFLPKADKGKMRMPGASEKKALLKRDGYHCRFCTAPVIRAEIRSKIAKVFPDALSWGNSNLSQHAAFQAMWVQYDHLIPHARGGDNSLGNMVITCAPCNFARMQHTLEEVGLINPLHREPFRSEWNGLEDF